MYQLTATELSHRFGARRVFAEIGFDVMTGRSMVVTGPNGSGKSTLLMVLLGLLEPSRGQVSYWADGSRLSADEFRRRCLLVAPYQSLYDQLTAEENLKFFASLRDLSPTGKELSEVLARVGLEGRGDDRVDEYSSGMKQRLKLALVLALRPVFVFLDEPSTNLDESGKLVMRQVINDVRAQSVLVVATNEADEVALAEQEVSLAG
jgi:heme exporter protein A